MKAISIAALAVFLVFTGVLHPLVEMPSLASASGEPLRIETASKQVLKAGERPVIDLVGQGLNKGVTASLIQTTMSGQEVQHVYPVPGIINDSLIVGDVLFLASSHHGGVLAINIEDPEQPRLFDEYLVERAVFTLYQFDHFLFAVCRDERIAVLKIEPDGRLSFLKDIETPTRILELRISHGYMAVAAGTQGALLYRLSSDLDATLLHHLQTSSPVNDIEMFDTYIYWPQKNGLAVLAINNERFELLDEVPLTRAGDLYKAQGDLFVAGKEVLYRLSLETPGHPTLISELSGFRDIVRLFSGDNVLYALDGYAHLVIVDPVTMTVASKVSFESDTRVISERAGRLYAAGSGSGLKVIDNTALHDPVPLKVIKTVSRCYDLQKIDHWLYAATTRGLLRMNLGAGEGAFVPFSLRKNARSFSLDKDRRRLYVACGNSGIGVFDVSDPDAVKELAFWKDFPALKLAVSDDLLVVSRGAYGMTLIDISNLQEPVVSQSLTDIQVLDLAVEGNNLFVASKEDGLINYQITPDNKVKRRGNAVLPFPMNHFSHAASVVINSPYAYVANGRSGLTVVDVRKPENMKIVDLLKIEGFAKKVVIDDGRILVASPEGVSVVDILNSSDPQIAGYFPIQGLSRGLAANKGTIYASLTDTGVSVVPMPVEAESMDFQKEDRLRIIFPPVQSPGKFDLFIARDGTFQVLRNVVVVND